MILAINGYLLQEIKRSREFQEISTVGFLGLQIEDIRLPKCGLAMI